MSRRDLYEKLAPLRAQLGDKKGHEYWRSFEELAETEEFQDLLHREFPPQAHEWNDPVGRRNFLKLMSASLALAGLTGCTVQPKEEIVPYVQPPDNMTPGKPQMYATAFTLGGVAEGLLVRTNDGRPTKIEGNPDHPSSLGAASTLAQAALLQMYDPDRSQTVTYVGDTRVWGEFLNEIRAAVEAQRGKQGKGLRLLTETVTSPTLGAQIKQLLTELPEARWHQYDASGGDGARLGAQLAFGQFANTVYKIENAEVILSLDANFLASGPGGLRYAREFAKKRRVIEGHHEMNRLYVAESILTPTGAKADHRLPVRSTDIEALARAIAAKVGALTGSAPTLDPAAEKWATAVASDLQKQRGKCVVIAGEHQSAAVHAVAHAINGALGNVGQTVIYTDPLETTPVNHFESLRELVNDINSERVELLIILGGNPVYNAPADLKFLDALKKIPLRVHLSLYNDETSEYCQWHVPEAHFLEAWGDARAYDGTVSIIQPMIQPLYNGKSALEVMAILLNKPGLTSYDVLRESWKTQLGADFETGWRKSVHDGVVVNSALPAKTVALKGDWATGLKPINSSKEIEVVFRPDPYMLDGRFTNNGWLQGLAKPITKLTWENAALISPATATQKLNLAPAGKPYEANGKVIEIENQGRKIAAPVWVVPGHADNSVTLTLGYGRSRAGHVGTGIGYNAFQLVSVDAPSIVNGARVLATDRSLPLASTQEHFTIDGLEERQIIRTATLDAYVKDPESIFHPFEKFNPDNNMSLYDPHPYPGYAWGMVIDMNSCVGCNACVVACQAENNIPVSTKDMIQRNREMHWIRIDTYFRGSIDNPETFFQPMLCQHCEQAPCEVVCPVNATVHDAEGLNVQVYNRCVGTRYCSNNCPYKVRRFNYLLYNDYDTPSLKLMRNPEVTVRSRGVMEKCTYCVQRIMYAKIESEKENRKIRDGEIVTACQQTCPAEAIVFGDINDPQSRVAKLRQEHRNYGVLAEIGTRPRTTYLAEIRNPNAELAPSGERREGQHG
jgi:molybdopterin-containing oxidoreductase family iron-sulfur binding subunit